MLLKTSLRSFYAHKGRMALSLIAVMLSVAFVSGTLVFTDTATATFDRLFASTAADISIQQTPDKITGAPPGVIGPDVTTVPVDTLRKVAAQPGVKTAVGHVQGGTATLVDPATDKAVGANGPTLVGNWTDSPRRSLNITSGHAPEDSSEIVLDADTAKSAHLTVGDRLRVIAQSGDYVFTISGIASFTTTNPGSTLAFLDTATAQKDLLGKEGYTSVDAYGDGSRTNEQLKTEALRALGSGFAVQTAAEQTAANQQGVDGGLAFLKYILLGFAGISLLVGGFLIINTFSMLVAQRTREIGLLRAIGGSRRQVNRTVLVEALLLGVLGSTLGIAAGLGVANLLIAGMQALGFNLGSPSLEIGASVPVASYAVGVLITVLAAWIPARRAGRISPMAALRDHGTPSEPMAGRVRAWIGLAVTGLGVVALIGAATASSAGSGGMLLAVAILLTLIGFVVLGPLFATGAVRVLGAALPALFGPSGKLAQRNAMRNPPRTGATAAALMIGLAVVTGFSVVASSMVSSTSAQLDKSVGADYVARPSGPGFTPAMVSAAGATPGLDHLTVWMSVTAEITTPDGWNSGRTVVDAGSPTLTDDFHFPAASGRPEAAFNGGISVDQSFAAAHNLTVGDRLKVDYGHGHTQSLPIGAILRTGNKLFDGKYFTGIDTVAKVVPADQLPPAESLLAKAAPGADKAATLTALQKSLAAYPGTTVEDRTGYKKAVQSQVDQLLNIVYGLLGLAIVVAVLGVVNTLALSVVERTREIGLLRAIGLSRRQLRRMICLESVVIAVFGALLGTGLGLLWGVASRSVLKSQGLETLSIPYGSIVTVLIASAAVGLVAAVLPAFRAGRMNVLAAIATD